MIIIGHRGAAGLAPENTIASMQAGLDSGADMIELDVRLTRDGIPVLIHDKTTRRTHNENVCVNRTTLADLQADTIDEPIPTLNDVLHQFFGRIILNIECKEIGSGSVVFDIVAPYITHKTDWQYVIFSSFYASELRAIREKSIDAPLALIHKHNPFSFVQHHAFLNLSAVGFSKLTMNPLAIAIAKKRGIKTYVYTVNKVTTAKVIERQGLDGIVTNYPNIFTGKS